MVRPLWLAATGGSAGAFACTDCARPLVGGWYGLRRWVVRFASVGGTVCVGGWYTWVDSDQCLRGFFASPTYDIRQSTRKSRSVGMYSYVQRMRAGRRSRPLGAGRRPRRVVGSGDGNGARAGAVQVRGAGSEGAWFGSPAPGSVPRRLVRVRRRYREYAGTSSSCCRACSPRAGDGTAGGAGAGSVSTVRRARSAVSWRGRSRRSPSWT